MDDHEASRNVRNAMDTWEKSLPQVSKSLDHMAALPDLSESVRLATTLPDLSVTLRRATALPDLSETLRQAAMLPDLSETLRALQPMPDLTPALRTLQTMPDLTPTLRSLQLTPDLAPLLSALQATPDLTPMLRTLQTLPDVKELRQLAESTHIRRAWQEALTSFVGLSEIQDVLEEWSLSDDGIQSIDDADSGLSRIDAMRYQLHMMLLNVLSRDVLRQDAAVQADLLLGLIWLVELVIQQSLGQ